MPNVSPESINGLAKDMGIEEIPRAVIVRAMRMTISRDDKDLVPSYKGEGILLHVLNVARTIHNNGRNGDGH